VSRGRRARHSEITAHSFYSIDVGRDRQRAPDQINTPTDERRRIGRIPAEDRGSKVSVKQPARRERASRVLSVEGVDVEVLDPIPSVEKVKRSTLAKGDAKNAVLIRSPPRPALESLLPVEPGNRGQELEVLLTDRLVAPPVHALG